MDVGVVRRAARVVNDAVRLVVVAKPRSKKEGIEASSDGALVLRVQAPPVEGAANARLVEVLADALRIRRADVSLVRGEGARHKEVEIRGLSLDEVVARLGAREGPQP